MGSEETMVAQPVWPAPDARHAVLQQARQDRLELLYLQSGRGAPGHPQRGLYTGLIASAPSAQVAGSATPPPAAASADQAEQPEGSPNPTAQSAQLQ